MAFTGSQTVIEVSNRKVRVIGLSLDADSRGIIGIPLSPTPVPQLGAEPDFFIDLPTWRAYRNDRDVNISLDDAVESRAPSTALFTVPDRIVIEKGTFPGNYFFIAYTNLDALLASGPLEIWLEYH